MTPATSAPTKSGSKPETPVVKAGRVYDMISRLCGIVRNQELDRWPRSADIQTELEVLGQLAETEEAKMYIAAAVHQYVLAAQLASLEETTAPNKSRTADIAAEMFVQCKRLLATAYPVGF